MRCFYCRAENRPGADYCDTCGAAMAGGAPGKLGPVREPPQQPIRRTGPAIEYMGFWIRLGADVIDTLILMGGQAILNILGDAVVVGLVLGFGYSVLFTGLRGQTLGKMVFGIMVVDELGDLPGLRRAFVREVPGKLISFLVLGLGFLWIAWDERKQGWHDKIAKTYVVRKPQQER